MLEYNIKQISFFQQDVPVGRVLLCAPDIELLATVQKKCSQSDISVLSLSTIQNWQEGENDFLEGRYACIFAGRVLERIDNPHLLSKEMAKHLMDNGCLIAAFANIRHWRNCQELLTGHWRYDGTGVREEGVRHYFAQPEFVELLQSADYGDICFDACMDEAPAEFIQRLTTLGAVNSQDDLSTAYWVVRASRKWNPTLWLQQSFTPEIRQQLVYLLRRIETGIDVTRNCNSLWQLCENYSVTAEYLLPLIDNTMLYPQVVLSRLAESSDGRSRNG